MTATPTAPPVRHRVDRPLAVASAAQLALLAALSASVGLGLPGWLAGVAFAAGLWALVAGAAGRAGATTLGPADLVTLARSVLVGGVTALVADGFLTGRPTPVAVLVVLAAVALVLDGVDGRVARRTGTVSAFGARFDMEVDAFLLLVLSVHAVAEVGPWALAIGAMRYAYVAASWALPWLRGALPVRYSAKVVAASAGIVLVVVASGLLPRTSAVVLVLATLAALVWSFGKGVAWLWRARGGRADGGAARGDRLLGRLRALRVPPLPRAVDRGLTALAALVVFVVLVAPGVGTPWALLRIPAEAIVGVVLVLVLPPRLRSAVAVAGGAVLGVLLILTALDTGFRSVLGRPFDPVVDWTLLGNAREFLAGSLGPTWATGAAVGAVLLAVLAVVLVALAARRLSRAVDRHRTTATRVAAVLSVVWLAAFGLGLPLASRSAAALAYEKATQVPVSLREQREFAAQVASDPLPPATAAVPEEVLEGLRGKDVVLTFVESYGRSAVEDPRYAPRVGAALRAASVRLTAKGFAARSGWLTSPVAGGGSWMAHATLVSGLRIDNQQRYDGLVAGDRLTLTKAFQNAGWETTDVMPGTDRAWPEGAYFGFDRIHDGPGLAYEGRNFAWSPMPDQYTLAQFQRLEHGRADRGPLMAQIELTSSHVPWWPYPKLVDWDAVGDGSVFTAQAERGGPPERIWNDDDRLRTAYRDSTVYSLETVLSFVERYGDDRLVFVFLGDHQPASVITGENASHDVPITIVARDPAVLDRIADWGWDEGLAPGARAPVWPMEAFRDRFLSAFGAAPSH